MPAQLHVCLLQGFNTDHVGVCDKAKCLHNCMSVSATGLTLTMHVWGCDRAKFPAKMHVCLLQGSYTDHVCGGCDRAKCLYNCMSVPSRGLILTKNFQFVLFFILIYILYMAKYQVCTHLDVIKVQSTAI